MVCLIYSEGEVFDDKKTEWEEPSPDTEENKPNTEEYVQKIIQLIIILIILSNYLKCIDSGPAEDAEESEEQSEEAKEMTFEEWKELQEKYRSKMSYDMRKPGEGEKKGQWKNTKVLTKKSDEDDDRQQVILMAINYFNF